MKEEVVDYIILFLLGTDNSKLRQFISYGEQNNVKVIIEKSNFFGDSILYTEATRPAEELVYLDGVPVLFGNNKITLNNDRIYIGADIIASTFYLISRYEELINRKRDKHGRLTAHDCYLDIKILGRPVVDEYGALLRTYMRIVGLNPKEPPNTVHKIYLTHDVDEIWRWDSLYKAVRSFGKRVFTHSGHYFESLLGLIDYKKFDTIYSFPWLEERDNILKNKLEENMVEDIYFIKGGGVTSSDNRYYTNIKRYKDLLIYLNNRGSTIGLHTSYSSGERPELIYSEVKYLELLSECCIRYNRNHYLDSREPEDMVQLIEAGITDDFTMGYADCIGFRLGTCRAVRWINPKTLEVTKLILHPLTIMEHTLDAPFYMNLSKEKAYRLCIDMIDITKKYHGDLTLLWHNSTVAINENSYQRDLYSEVLDYIISICER